MRIKKPAHSCTYVDIGCDIERHVGGDDATHLDGPLAKQLSIDPADLSLMYCPARVKAQTHDLME
jgi:hypothetical protein